jgi:L-threonylcarbamoyladenylate synthase
LNVVQPTESALNEAAEALRDGRLVVIPTETVYGLAADATNEEAVKSIFEAKGRPAENPLIVHVAHRDWIDNLAIETPEYAYRLIREFWPGPLTVVLKKRPEVSGLVSAGLDTVGLRMPAHPVALRFIELVGRPIAAPSANKFTELSATRAQNVDPDLAAHAAMVLDGGACEFGLESTVVDCVGAVPRILRPGNISKLQIERLLGLEVLVGPGAGRRSPGLYPRHYSPKTALCLVERLAPDQAGLVLSELSNPGQVLMPSDPIAYGALLYETLHDLDQVGIDQIFVEMPPQSPEWAAVWDRLRKAAG